MLTQLRMLSLMPIESFRSSLHLLRSQIATQAASLPGSTLSGTPVFNIFTSTHLTTSGVPSRGWWPDWGFSEQEQGCRNGGAVPAYMNRNYDQYFSNTKRKCCEQWFPYNLKGCVGPTIGGSRKEYFVPSWSDEVCTKKQEGAMESWEFTDTFDSLEDCCKKRFFYNYVECCSVPRLEGCSTSTELFYYPDDGKCKAGSAGEVQEWKRIFAESSMKACCVRQTFGGRQVVAETLGGVDRIHDVNIFTSCFYNNLISKSLFLCTLIKINLLLACTIQC